MIEHRVDINNLKISILFSDYHFLSVLNDATYVSFNQNLKLAEKMLDFRNLKEKGRPPWTQTGLKIAIVILTILQSGSIVSSQSFISRGPLTEFNQVKIHPLF